MKVYHVPGFRRFADFAARESARFNTYRSRFIAHALSEIIVSEEGQLAAKGYRFYAREASEFAEASARAVAESLVGCPYLPSSDA